MQSSTYSSQYGAPSRPPATTTLSSLLAKANSLNNVDHDPELPQIRFGIDEIERMSEAAAGKGKRSKALNGEGHTLLSNLGINTSRLQSEIAQLPDAEPSRPARRRKHAHAPGRLAPLGDLGPAYAMGDADVGAWGRNWHEMVILSGIEVQRQKVGGSCSTLLIPQTVKAFQDQFQQRMLDNWEAEKSRVLQDELGVTDAELARLTTTNTTSSSGLASSSLGASRLGHSTRRFPMASSTLGKSSVESREGGLVMHNKAMRYEKVISVSAGV